MRVSIVIVLFSTLTCTVYCQMAEMMNNPALMMSMMKGGMMGGGMGGMMPGMMDPSQAPIMDPQMFAKLAKMATLLGPSAPAGKTASSTKQTMRGKTAQVVKKRTKPATTQSSGMDPFLMYTLMQSGQMDPMALMLMSQASKPAGATGSSGGLDPFTMMYLMQQGGGGGGFLG